MSEKELTGHDDINGTPIREGDVVRYEEDDDREELYTVTRVPDCWLLVSHEDYEYNAELGLFPVEIVNTPAGEGEEGKDEDRTRR